MFAGRLATISVTFAVALALTGCGVMRFGDKKLNSRYVYARSEVTPLRNVATTVETTRFGLTCGFSTAEYEAAYDEALSQVADANILLDYTTDYEILYFFPFICRNKLQVSGLAARADVR
jgi:hypothetical protein